MDNPILKRKSGHKNVGYTIFMAAFHRIPHFHGCFNIIVAPNFPLILVLCATPNDPVTQPPTKF